MGDFYPNVLFDPKKGDVVISYLIPTIIKEVFS